MGDFPVKGIRNLGNTCYISATLQCLYRCTVFKENLINCGDVTSSLVNIFQQFSSNDDIDPLYLLKALVSRPTSFLDYRHQNDAQEFLLELLDAVEKECKDASVPDATSVFYGKIAYLTRCENCKNITRRMETFVSVSFSTNYPWARETIEDFQCDHCNGRHLAEREGRILVAPKVFIIQILRFEGNGGKNKRKIDPPVNIDIGPVHLESLQSEIEFPYVSKGVICHEGYSLHRGHYYSLHFNNSKWIRCDDESVAIQDDVYEEDPYVLFYELES